MAAYRRVYDLLHVDMREYLQAKLLTALDRGRTDRYVMPTRTGRRRRRWVRPRHAARLAALTRSL